MNFQVSDIAMLIQGHIHRKQDFEAAVHDVLNKVATNLRDDQKAHVYAVIVETANPHTTIIDLEDIIKQALRKMPS